MASSTSENLTIVAISILSLGATPIPSSMRNDTTPARMANTPSLPRIDRFRHPKMIRQTDMTKGSANAKPFISCSDQIKIRATNGIVEATVSEINSRIRELFKEPIHSVLLFGCSKPSALFILGFRCRAIVSRPLFLPLWKLAQRIVGHTFFIDAVGIRGKQRNERFHFFHINQSVFGLVRKQL